MLRQLCCAITALVGCVTIAAAQQGAGAAGTWNATTTIGAKDSVGPTYVLKIAPDGKTATIRFVRRDPIPTRIVTMAGDSIVIETGPYASVLRPGQTVTLLRTVVHYNSNAMTGTFEAKYSNGDVVKGKTKARRAK
ncbi:MAG: hypothetical protein AUI86_08005 [Gemmatimonadetes bacterium 13_1_40CM_3_66_12]|nr:MAG: hypothetical protein AUI86_08005 [Gemmatimonadetes bacterium 13_1_40CM_3_66_12]